MSRLSLLILALLSGPVPASPLPPGAEAQMTQAVEAELRREGIPGAAVAVLKDGELVYLRAFGVRSLEERTPVTPDTLFRLGSTTKMLTSLVALDAAAKGKLGLDAPVGQVAKGVNPALGKLTLRQLLSHTAGMREASASVESRDDEALGRMVRSWKADYLFAPPGDVFSYSGPGYWLAGYVLEGIYGAAYPELMRTQLFTPMGMTRSTLRPLEALTWDFAQGHEPGKDGALGVVRPMAENTAMYPAGSVFSSAKELAQLAKVLLAGGRNGERQVLSAQAVKDLFSAHVLLPGDGSARYGFGLVQLKVGGLTAYEHGGVRRGYGSHIRFLPEQRGAVILLTNSNGQTLRRSLDVITRAAWGLPEEPETTPPALPLTAAEAQRFTGTYAHKELVSLAVRWDGSRLLVKSEEEQPLERVGDGVFRTKEGSEYAFIARPGEKRARYLNADMLTLVRAR